MNEKRRRRFVGYQRHARMPVKRCWGVLYDEGNVQILWRSDIGWTAEQYASIASAFGLVKGLDRIDIEGVLP